MIAIYLSRRGRRSLEVPSDTPVRRSARWILRLVKEWHYRSEIHKLQGMSDRQLSDIGLSRSRIEEAVRGDMPAKGEPVGKLRTLFHP